MEIADHCGDDFGAWEHELTVDNPKTREQRRLDAYRPPSRPDDGEYRVPSKLVRFGQNVVTFMVTPIRAEDRRRQLIEPSIELDRDGRASS